MSEEVQNRLEELVQELRWYREHVKYCHDDLEDMKIATDSLDWNIGNVIMCIEREVVVECY